MKSFENRMFSFCIKLFFFFLTEVHLNVWNQIIVLTGSFPGVGLLCACKHTHCSFGAFAKTGCAYRAFFLRILGPHMMKHFSLWCGHFCPDLKRFFLSKLSNRYVKNRWKTWQSCFVSLFLVLQRCVSFSPGLHHDGWGVLSFGGVFDFSTRGAENSAAVSERLEPDGDQWQASIAHNSFENCLVFFSSPFISTGTKFFLVQRWEVQRFAPQNFLICRPTVFKFDKPLRFTSYKLCTREHSWPEQGRTGSPLSDCFYQPCIPVCQEQLCC